MMVRMVAGALSALLIFTTTAQSTAAHAADCPRKDALGVSRTLSVDAQNFPRVGLKSFLQTLPLADKEVVLTFDDGPFPPTTKRVLASLAEQCVRATFFLIGRNAEANPSMVKEIAAAGHSIGNHTWSHRILSRIQPSQAMSEIDHGARAIEAALDGGASKEHQLTFFRFPGFASTPALLASLQSRNIAVFGADVWASDWNKMSPQQELRLLTERLRQAKKGIILLHDIKAQTAAMLPAFLNYLRQNGYQVVHLMPKPSAANAAVAR